MLNQSQTTATCCATVCITRFFSILFTSFMHIVAIVMSRINNARRNVRRMSRVILADFKRSMIHGKISSLEYEAHNQQ